MTLNLQRYICQRHHAHTPREHQTLCLQGPGMCRSTCALQMPPGNSHVPVHSPTSLQAQSFGNLGDTVYGHSQHACMLLSSTLAPTQQGAVQLEHPLSQTMGLPHL